MGKRGVYRIEANLVASSKPKTRLKTPQKPLNLGGRNDHIAM